MAKNVSKTYSTGNKTIASASIPDNCAPSTASGLRTLINNHFSTCSGSVTWNATVRNLVNSQQSGAVVITVGSNNTYTSSAKTIASKGTGAFSGSFSFSNPNNPYINCNVNNGNLELVAITWAANITITFSVPTYGSSIKAESITKLGITISPSSSGLLAQNTKFSWVGNTQVEQITLAGSSCSIDTFNTILNEVGN